MCLKWRERADEFLKSLSWDSVWDGMSRLIAGHLDSEETVPAGSHVLAQSRQENAARV
jgi:hypothetical protein